MLLVTKPVTPNTAARSNARMIGVENNKPAYNANENNKEVL